MKRIQSLDILRGIGMLGLVFMHVFEQVGWINITTMFEKEWYVWLPLGLFMYFASWKGVFLLISGVANAYGFQKAIENGKDKVKEINEKYLEKTIEKGKETFKEYNEKYLTKNIEKGKEYVEGPYNKLTDKVDDVLAKGRDIEKDALKKLDEFVENGKKFMYKIPMVETVEKKMTDGLNSLPGMINMPDKSEIKKLTLAMKMLNSNIESLKAQKAL